MQAAWRRLVARCAVLASGLLDDELQMVREWRPRVALFERLRQSVLTAQRDYLLKVLWLGDVML